MNLKKKIYPKTIDYLLHHRTIYRGSFDPIKCTPAQNLGGFQTFENWVKASLETVPCGSWMTEEIRGLWEGTHQRSY